MIPLVLLPGLLNDADLWRDQIEALSDIVECQVGDITRGGSLEELAERVLAEAPSSFVLSGFSLGGYVAQGILRRAEPVSKVAFLDTSVHPDSPERAATSQALNRAAQAPGRFQGFGDRLLATYLDPAHLSDESIVSRIRAMTEGLGPEVFVRQNNVERKDGPDLIAGLACPVLVVCGENDALTHVSEHHCMAALAPEAVLVIAPGTSGHMTPIEAPHAVSEALRTWLLSGPRNATYTEA